MQQWLEDLQMERSDENDWQDFGSRTLVNYKLIMTHK